MLVQKENKMSIKIFFDTEFTGLHSNTTLISLGMITENSHTFYAEFTDYAYGQLDPWLKENVIANLKFNEDKEFCRTEDSYPSSVSIKDNESNIKEELIKWLSQFDQIEMWSDCLAYDWVLFCEIFGGALNIPKNIYYIPFDLCTLFKVKGMDPNVNRKEFYEGYGHKIIGNQHNALYDATLIRDCYELLMD